MAQGLLVVLLAEVRVLQMLETESFWNQSPHENALCILLNQ